MKIQPFVKTTLQKNQYRNNNKTQQYLSSPMLSNSPIHIDTVSFKGNKAEEELNAILNKLNDAKKLLQASEDGIQEYKQISAEIIQELDAEIDTKKREEVALNIEIQQMEKLKSLKGSVIEDLKTHNNGLQQSLQKTQEGLNQLETTKVTITEQIIQNNDLATKKKLETIGHVTAVTNNVIQQRTISALSGPRSILTKRIIGPTQLESKKTAVQIPSGVLIQSKSEKFSKKVFEWMVKKSDANYAIIDANSFTKEKLFKILNGISEKSKKEFEKTGKRTFTYIENFESCASPKLENETIIGGLKTFLDDCSKENHNTLVVSTINPTNLDPIVSGAHRFPVNVNLNDEFLEDKVFGFDSIIKEIPDLKSTGKPLKIPFVDLLFNSTKKSIKQLQVSQTSSSIKDYLDIAFDEIKTAKTESSVNNDESGRLNKDTGVFLQQLHQENEAKLAELKKLEELSKIQNNNILTPIKEIEQKLEKEGFNYTGFDRIGGYSGIKAQLKNILIDPIALKQTGLDATIPNSILFYGPPHIGKTITARAVAEETKSNFVAIEPTQNNYEDLFKDLTKIAQQSSTEYMKTGNRTVVLLEDVERFKDQHSISILKNFISNCAEKYNCIVVMTSKEPSLIDNSLIKDIPGLFFDTPAEYYFQDILKTMKMYIEKKYTGRVNLEKIAQKIIEKIENASDSTFSPGKIKEIVVSCYTKGHSSYGDVRQNDLIQAFKEAVPDLTKKSMTKFINFNPRK